MVKQKTFNWIVIILFTTGLLNSQSLLEKSPKKLFWGLITIDKETANRVLLGEINIEQAVRKYTEKLIKTKQ